MRLPPGFWRNLLFTTEGKMTYAGLIAICIACACVIALCLAL